MVWDDPVLKKSAFLAVADCIDEMLLQGPLPYLRNLGIVDLDLVLYHFHNCLNRDLEDKEAA